MESFLWRKKCYPWQLKFTSSSPLPRFLSRKGCVFLPWLDSEVRKQSQAALLAEKTEHTQRRAQHSRKDKGRLLLSMPRQRFSPSTCFHFLPLHLPDLLRGSHIFIHCSGPCRLPADLQGWKAGPLAARVSLVTAQSLAGGPCCEQPCWATALPKLRLPSGQCAPALRAHPNLRALYGVGCTQPLFWLHCSPHFPFANPASFPSPPDVNLQNTPQ